MKVNSSFGKWLKQRRKALDLTQVELADQVGYAAVTIRKIEHDIARPSKQMTHRLADALAIAANERADFVAFARHTSQNLPLLPVSKGHESEELEIGLH
jgi:transcriptional regulator with XRE-family HTH domain